MQAERQGAPIDQKLGKVARQTPFEQKIRNVVNGVVEVGKAIAMLPLSCGYVNFDGIKRGVHDHGGKKVVSAGWAAKEDYDPSKHGSLINWVEEGQPIPDFPRGNKGETAIHRHNSGARSGSHEYGYE